MLEPSLVFSFGFVFLLGRPKHQESLPHWAGHHRIHFEGSIFWHNFQLPKDINSVQDWGVSHVAIFSLTSRVTPSVPGFQAMLNATKYGGMVTTNDDNLPHLHFLEAPLQLSPMHMQPEISWWKYFLRFWHRFCRNVCLLFRVSASEKSQSDSTNLRTSGKEGRS